ncbi:Lrp/AsnC ligand binding domain-containing protein [Draconibacterium sp.]|nr:Lrp/AsnC ligand binding domain-containing protein [Draconibacterium sp.]
MSAHDLSRIDRKILRCLQQNARLSFAELARQVGLTTTPCKERVKRLERDGYIAGYHARLDPSKLDRGLVVFVQITLQRTAGDAFREFTEAIQDVPEVEECYLIAGNFDYLIKARVKDMTEYREFLGGSLMQLPGVQESTSYPVMEKAAERTVTGL